MAAFEKSNAKSFLSIAISINLAKLGATRQDIKIVLYNEVKGQ